ncbi:sulfotransferase family protein [Fodinibius sp. AD559]|uniref:sulfotransferase family protein n=1 Tax=Fodinibius sp. AD559 TaxID=3424179 RepID=UPI0040468A28
MQNVAIFGVPRSGTSWLGQIFNSSPKVVYRYQPIFAYSFDGSLTAESSSKEIARFHEELLHTDDDFVCQKQNISGNQTPTFSKEECTHLVWKEVRYLDIIHNLLEQSEIKIVGIVRHPCGTIHSWQKAPREFNNQWDILEEWRHADKKNTSEHDFYGYERWLDATRMFLHLQENFPNRFHLLCYEKLADDPEKYTKEAFDFAGLAMEEQTETFLKESTASTSDDPYDVYRKNKTGFEWISQLNPVIINEIKTDDRFLEIEKHFGWNTLEQKKR